ncbi:MAG: cobalt-zinc-cadmium efflux system membrane fusion protein [Phenylobacterium sp.]|jgi:cobalt-zinc-cadmium efflux system membrane fusion protein
MNKYLITSLLTLSLLLTSMAAPTVYASEEHGAEHKDEHGDGHKDEHGDEHESGQVELSAALASKAGIKTASATGGEIKQTVNVYGQSVVDPSAVGQIRARFAGLITQLNADIGDTVKAGEVMVEIESNLSLKRYTITSPISGVVTERNANPGEIANQQVLLTVVNDQQLWVDYKIFPGQAQQLKKGQPVTVFNDQIEAQSEIKYLLLAPSNQPFVIASVPLDNSQGQWSTGMLLSGSVVVNKVQVPLMVDNRAIQIMEGQQVIFVKTDHGYQTRTVTFGQTDGQFTEVTSGLALGEQYAVQNSYLLKADLEKSSAAHHH